MNESTGLKSPIIFFSVSKKERFIPALKRAGYSVAENKILLAALLLVTNLFFITSVLAVTDPLTSPNNRFGIHIISPTQQEASEAAQLVNSSGGDWGYVTLLIERKDRHLDKWQNFFNELRRRHLIPIVRVATEPQGGFWAKPSDDDAKNWAIFLNSLNWPIKNRYVVIYNEPNHGQEWAGQANPAEYAKVLNQTIDELKKTSPDFYVLNAGFDASAPMQSPLYYDQLVFMQEMEKSVPGIFNKLDGWSSHAYPNPNFAGSPHDQGRRSIRGWQWELEVLKNFGINKKLPVFITETGWKHAEGLTFDRSYPTTDRLGSYFQSAFQNAWNNELIVAVTPFLLNYQESPFDHFSFKKITGEIQNDKILGESFPHYYPHYQSVIDLPKNAGRPAKINQAKLIEGSIYTSVVVNETYSLPLTFKNTGQAIWNDEKNLILKAEGNRDDLGITLMNLETKDKIEPGGTATLLVVLNPKQLGSYTISFKLFDGDQQIEHPQIQYEVEVKSPVVLSIKAGMAYKNNPEGEYDLIAQSPWLTAGEKIAITQSGSSSNIEAKALLPDQEYTFTLSKPYYKIKTVKQIVRPGLNTIDFGELDPNFIAALGKPSQLWQLLPFSN